jgi:hypothetical protein
MPASAPPFNASNHLFDFIFAVPLIDTLILDESAEDRQRINAKLSVCNFYIFVGSQVPI